MTVDIITNHDEQAQARKLEQWKNKPNLQSMLEIYTKQIQELEDVIHSLFTNRTVDGAFGATLDLVGAIPGQNRLGRNDSDYQILIKARISANTSLSIPEHVINVFKLLTGSVWVHNVSLGRAEIRLTGAIDLGSQDNINFIIQNTTRAIADGTRIDKIICASEDCAFAYAGPNVQAVAKGFSDGSPSPTTGGLYAQEYTEKFPFAYSGVITGFKGFGSVIDPLIGGVYRS